MQRAWVIIAVLAGCSPPAEPPGRSSAPAAASLPRPVLTAAQAPADAPDAHDEALPSPDHKIASIAMRTWVYDRPEDRATKLGYLRAGAVVDRAPTSAGTDGCEGGWYRVRPRGYVCVGKGATLELDHEVVQAAIKGPDRAGSIPYDYVLSRDPAPHLYFVLPTVEEQKRAEGGSWASALSRSAVLQEGSEAAEIPAFLSEGKELPKPYGAEKRLHYLVHAGKASPNSAFGLITQFDWTERRFGLTTELDLIPLDRTKPAKISKLQGVAIKDGGVPAFVVAGGTASYKEVDGAYLRDGNVDGRSAWELTGRNNGHAHGLLETTEGVWLAREALKLGELREDIAGFSERGRKWISVSIKNQMLIAYEGKVPVYAALVSTGRGGMADPQESHATVRGTFMIHAKHVSGLMDGDEASDEAFELHDVPYIQYFHEGYALHGAYWHDEFGRERSHGCVNLTPHDAHWLFEWTDPVVPENWHGAINLEAGTLVYVHY